MRDKSEDILAIIEKAREVGSPKVTLLESEAANFDDFNVSPTVDPEILILLSELDEHSPSLPHFMKRVRGFN